MTDKLNWQGFRSSHKLPSSKKEYKSLMWNAYKEDDRIAYVDAAERAEFEIPEEVKGWLEGPKTELQKLKEDTPVEDVPTEEKTPKKKSVKKKTSDKPSDDLYVEYAQLERKLHRFPHAYDAKQKREMNERLVEIADKTRPSNYKCTPTDGWQIWFGPTQACLLINTTRHIAFTCSRSWWTKRYLNARYVHNQLVHDVKQIDRMRAEYEIRKKLVKRAPLPDVEIMVPTTAADYVMRG